MPGWLPAVAIAIVVASRLAALAFPDAVPPTTIRLLLPVVGSTAAVAGGVGAIVSLARWRAVGDAPALWYGLALLLYGLGGAGVGTLLASLGAAADLDLVAALPPASLFVALLLFAGGATTPAVDTRLKPSRLAPAALVALAVCTVMLAGVPAAAVRVAGAALAAPAAVLAWAALRRGHRERRRLALWSGVCLAAVAVDGLLPAGTGMAMLAGELLRLAGLLLAVHGAVHEMVRSLREQGARLLRTQVDVQRAEERVRAEHELAQERAHEARSALAAIEGATSTLERHHDQLPGEVRRHLVVAVSAEIRRLQALVTPAEAQEPVRPFALDEVLAPLVAVEQAREARITCRIPAGLAVAGRPGATAEILQTLLDNARQHASGSPVLVRAESDGDRVVVRVEDRGPGVAAALREAIFERGVRAAAPDVAGEGIGLYVASRLAREQGGRLWVEERPGGGASFALALPAVTRPERVDEAAHLLQGV